MITITTTATITAMDLTTLALEYRELMRMIVFETPIDGLGSLLRSCSLILKSLNEGDLEKLKRKFLTTHSFLKKGRKVVVDCFPNGKREGVCRTYIIDVFDIELDCKCFLKGLIKEKHYRNGVKHGSWKTFAFGKPKEEFYYVDGKMEGRYTQRDVFGNLSDESFYKEGKLHGYSYGWYANTISDIKIYRMGKLHGVQKVFDKNRNLIGISNFRDGLLHGVHKEWEGGHLKIDMFAENGETLVSRFWHDNGTLATKGRLRGEHIVQKRWDENGILISRKLLNLKEEIEKAKNACMFIGEETIHDEDIYDQDIYDEDLYDQDVREYVEKMAKESSEDEKN